jgi:hypothetical protein
MPPPLRKQFIKQDKALFRQPGFARWEDGDGGGREGGYHAVEFGEVFLWEGFVEAFLLEGVDFLGGEDRVLVFVAEEEDSLEGGDDRWFEVLFFKVEERGLLLA